MGQWLQRPLQSRLISYDSLLTRWSLSSFEETANSRADYTCVAKIRRPAVCSRTDDPQAYDSHCNLVLGEVEETVYVVDEDDDEEDVKVDPAHGFFLNHGLLMSRQSKNSRRCCLFEAGGSWRAIRSHTDLNRRQRCPNIPTSSVMMRLDQRNN